MARGIPAKALAPINTDSGGRDASDAAVDGAVDPVGSPCFIVHKRWEGVTLSGPADSVALVGNSLFSFRIMDFWYIMNETVSGSLSFGLWNQWSQHIGDYTTGAAANTIARASGMPPTEAAGVFQPGNEGRNADLRVIKKGETLFLSSNGGHEMNMDLYLLCCRV